MTRTSKSFQHSKSGPQKNKNAKQGNKPSPFNVEFSLVSSANGNQPQVNLAPSGNVWASKIDHGGDASEKQETQSHIVNETLKNNDGRKMASQASTETSAAENKAVSSQGDAQSLNKHEFRSNIGGGAPSDASYNGPQQKGTGFNAYNGRRESQFSRNEREGYNQQNTSVQRTQGGKMDTTDVSVPKANVEQASEKKQNASATQLYLSVFESDWSAVDAEEVMNVDDLELFNRDWEHRKNFIVEKV